MNDWICVHQETIGGRWNVEQGDTSKCVNRYDRWKTRFETESGFFIIFTEITTYAQFVSGRYISLSRERVDLSENEGNQKSIPTNGATVSLWNQK